MRVARRRSWIGALALLVALGLPAGASAAPHNPAGSVSLTDGRTFAYWAHPQQRATVRRLPSRGSRRVARLHLKTEDGFPEVYPVLRAFADRRKRLWVRIRVPMRPNGRTGWVRASALGPLDRIRTRLLVDRRRLRATLYRSGRRIWRSRIGVGTPSTPTPGGHFWIREKFRVANARRIVRPAGLRDRRLLGAERVARRRRRRNPWNRPAVAHPGPALARLHPRAQRGDHASRAAHADRDPRPHPLSGRVVSRTSRCPPRSRSRRDP